MTTTLRLIAFTALTLSALVSSVSAQTVAPITSGDALMNQHLGTRYKGLERSAWVNKLMPAGVGEAPVQMASFELAGQRGGDVDELAFQVTLVGGRFAARTGAEEEGREGDERGLSGGIVFHVLGVRRG